MTPIYVTLNGNIQVGEDIYPTGDLVADFDVHSSRLILHSSSKKNVAFQAPYTDLSNKDGVPFENFDQFKLYLEASLQYETYINTISIVIADAGATLNKFGALNALTNGLEFYYWNQQNGKYSIVSGIKTNFEMLRAGCFEPAFGTANDAFLASNVSGTSEAYCINIDMEDVFGLQWGLRLRKNSTDRIGFIVKDDITGLDFMDIKVFGLRV